MTEADESAKLYAALGHPLRKKLIEYLDKTGAAGFKELKQSLEVTVGTLYYHLEILGDLIEHDPQGKYMLSEKGKAAKKLLTSGSEIQASSALSVTSGLTFRQFTKEVFLAPRLFKAVSARPSLFIPGAVVILALAAYLFDQARLEPTLLLYVTQPALRSLTYVAGEVLASWLGLFLLSEVSCYLLYKRLGGELALAIGIPFSLLPSLTLPLLLSFGLSLGVGPALFTLAFLTLQAWSFLLLTALIALVKGLTVEKGAIVTLILVFLNLATYTIAFARV